MDAGEALLALLLIPGGAAILILLTPQRCPSLIRSIALLAAVAMLADAAYIFAVYDYHNGGLQFDLQYTWIENVATKLAAGCTECDSHTYIRLMHHSIDNIVQRLTPELVKR